MTASCLTGTCQISEKIWGIVCPKSNTLHRLTFSKSLADHIVGITKGYEVRRFLFAVGKPLERGQDSSTGIYGIMSKAKNYALRVSLMKETAMLLSDDETRSMAEVYLKEVAVKRV